METSKSVENRSTAFIGRCLRALGAALWAVPVRFAPAIVPFGRLAAWALAAVLGIASWTAVFWAISLWCGPGASETVRFLLGLGLLVSGVGALAVSCVIAFMGIFYLYHGLFETMLDRLYGIEVPADIYDEELESLRELCWKYGLPLIIIRLLIVAVELGAEAWRTGQKRFRADPRTEA
jgi:hypothetical protein